MCSSSASSDCASGPGRTSRTISFFKRRLLGDPAREPQRGDAGLAVARVGEVVGGDRRRLRRDRPSGCGPSPSIPAAARRCRCRSPGNLSSTSSARMARVLGAQIVHLDLDVGAVERGIGLGERMHRGGAGRHRGRRAARRYRSPIQAWRSGLAMMSFRVIGRVHSKETRVCRWSRQFSPTPGRCATAAMPSSRSRALSPMPDSSSSCGLCTAPALTITSRVARAKCVSLADAVFHADGAALLDADALRRARRCAHAGCGGRAPGADRPRGRRSAGRAWYCSADSRRLRTGRRCSRAWPECRPRRRPCGRRRPACCGRSRLMLIGPSLAAHRAVALGVGLHALEERQHVVVAPAGIAEIAPVVVFGRLAAHPQHAVDRRGAAEHAAARPEHPAIADVRLGLGVEAPQAALATAARSPRRAEP